MKGNYNQVASNEDVASDEEPADPDLPVMHELDREAANRNGYISVGVPAKARCESHSIAPPHPPSPGLAHSRWNPKNKACFRHVQDNS